VTVASHRGHSLVVYRTSARADETLRRLWRAAREEGGRVTVIALAAEERTSKGCCDTRSVLWNGLCRDMAREDLARAGLVVEWDSEVDLRVIVAPNSRAPDALAREVTARGADQIVLADPGRTGLGRLELRRLRRRSPVPVT
jgi:hypothetical protein